VSPQQAVRLFIRELAHKNVSPADLPAVGLQHDRAFRAQGRGSRLVPIVLHCRGSNDELIVHPHRSSATQLQDTKTVPLPERPVSMDRGPIARRVGAVVVETAGTLFRMARVTMFATLFRRVPDLHLRRATQIDTAVRLGDRLVFETKIHIPIPTRRRGVGSFAIVHQLPILNCPMVNEFTLLRNDGIFLGQFLGTHHFLRGMRIVAIPADQIPTVEEGVKPLRRTRVRGGDGQQGNRQCTGDQGSKRRGFHERVYNL